MGRAKPAGVFVKPRFLCGGILLAALLACSPSVSRDDLVGRWKAKGPVLETRLVLHDDGSFEQAYVRYNKVEVTTQGTWSLEEAGRRSYVLMRHNTGSGNSSIAQGVSTHTVKWSWRGVALEDDPDQDVEYIRVAEW